MSCQCVDSKIRANPQSQGFYILTLKKNSQVLFNLAVENFEDDFSL